MVNVRYVLLISLVAALGGLLFGYDWVVIGGAKPFYEQFFQLRSATEIGWANSCALLGCLAGSLIAGTLSDRWGRKPVLLLAGCLFAISSVATGMASSFAVFVNWRIIGGVAIGMASNVSPVYIAEISPPMWRGRLVALNQLTIVIGILGAQIVNWCIAEKVPANATAELIRASWNGQYGWRWMFAAVAVPSVVFFVSALFVPESPRWLAARGRIEKAKRTLTRIGGEIYAEAELAQFQASESASQSLRNEELAVNHKQTSVAAEFFRSPLLRHILLLGIGLAVLQQWSGINVLFNYAEEIYRQAGYGVNDVLFNIVITGSVNLVFTLFALGFVDRFGRRPLMIAGCASIGLAHFLLGLAYRFGMRGWPVLVLTLCAIGCYGMSLAPVTWVLIAEIFPNRVRGTAVSIAVSALWIACFVLTYTFPIINSSLGPVWTFWLYALICFLGLVFVWKKVPETRARTLEQIEGEFAARLERPAGVAG